MKVKDINGNDIQVTDIHKAIAKAAEFMSYRHEDKSFEKLDRQLMAYWTDLHEKLQELQTKFKDNQNI